jgi:putative ABC transport system ATP-binding protein
VTPQVVIESLTKQYGALRAVDALSFSIEPGEWVALMGPSGSGKTTLINILGGLDTLTSGRVIVDAVDLAKLSEGEMVRYRAEKVGFVFQQFHLVPYLTALENVMLAQYFHSVTDENQAAEALRRVGLGDRLTHLPAQLSGGEQQRVAIARALINQPKLILADEPTGNLDEANEAIVLEIFRKLHDAGHTILMVTHDPDIARQADRRIELAHGHLHFDTAVQGAHPVNCPLAVSAADCCAGISTDDEIRFDHLLEQIWMFGEEGKSAEVASLRATGPVDRSTTAREPASLGGFREGTASVYPEERRAVPRDVDDARALAPEVKREPDRTVCETGSSLSAPLPTADRLAIASDDSATRLLARLSELRLVETHNGEVQLTPTGSRRARDVVRRHRLAERLFKDTFAIDDSEAHTQACKFEHIISPELDHRICTFLGHPKTCPHGNPIPPGACCDAKSKA